MPGLTFSNELISRDEGLHCDFACLLYSLLREPQRLIDNCMTACQLASTKLTPHSTNSSPLTRCSICGHNEPWRRSRLWRSRRSTRRRWTRCRMRRNWCAAAGGLWTPTASSWPPALSLTPARTRSTSSWTSTVRTSQTCSRLASNNISLATYKAV
uniref:Uncharacterized protein n=1 Tax=Ananas comosus var. bracteatus TaxID=296719 RepID=A0A6V7P9E6_ANACO|nr:unnamed protein product [Ananas comosus var. bracteatus]